MGTVTRSGTFADATEFNYAIAPWKFHFGFVDTKVKENLKRKEKKKKLIRKKELKE